MRTLTDSATHADDPDTLRARLAVDGYLYFRGLLPPDVVVAAGAEARAMLAARGWADTEERHSGATPGAVDAREAVGDPADRRAAGWPEFNRLPYLRPLRSLVRSLLGEDAFSYPLKVLRAVHPEGDRIPQGRYVHQDYMGLVVDDMLTSWIPLMPIPRQLGGLAVLPGSHLGAPPPVHVLDVDRAEAEGWASTDFSIGDVLLFHCLTSHAALPNLGDQLRLSQDCRWQSAHHPAPERVIYGPRAERDGEAMHRLLGSQPWWEPVPATLRFQPDDLRDGRTVASSRFFPVAYLERWAEGVRTHRL
ncbi:phytanoyl-CoA dioxygenase family protein [Actinomadura sp. NPDC023710]|uniref:phytanoyl-CoA dioxygenase family protein n=1 Tax=Actinomadura sp. NPDC023710 TaxID=3158219 RepID=UPI0033E03DDA